MPHQEKILKYVTILILVDGFLQSVTYHLNILMVKSHNPYFSRWFSAIQKMFEKYRLIKIVTILILVDGFLQLKK